MVYLIDTSVLIARERRLSPNEAAALAGDASSIAAVSVAELLHGVHRAQGVHQRLQRQRKVEAVLSALQVLPYTADIARVHAEIWAHLSETGKMIGAHDLIIAATALAHQLTLVTLNLRHFERIPGLVVVTFD